MAPADSEKRQVPAQGLADERQLEGIPLLEGGSQLGVRLLAVVLWIQVGAAGQEQGIDAAEHLRRVRGPARGQYQGQAARRLHRPHVILPEAEDLRFLASVLDGDADGGPPPIRSGMGMPSTRLRTSTCRTNTSTTSVRSGCSSSVPALSTE